ncbi:hypothetical protein D3C72_1395650 [compost metagenome]
MAVATPAMLPMPMRPAIDMARAWNEDTPASDFSPDTVRRHISTKPRICMKRVRRLKNRPAARHMKISALLQMMLLMKCTVASTRALSSRRVVRTSRRLEGTGRFSLIDGRCDSAVL